MFKKTDESEWTRFSRALQSQPAPQEAALEPDEDDTGEIAAAGQSESPDVSEDVPPPAHTRTEPAYAASAPPAYAPPAPQTYAPAPQAYPPAYAAAEPEPYAEPVSAPATTNSAPASVAGSVESAETVVGEGASFEGTLRSDRSIRVRGFLSGQIESRELVIVEATARVEARIVAEDVTVSGEVNGQIECAGRVEITPTGRVIGEVRTGRLAIQEGAFFQGQLAMLPNESGGSDEGASASNVLDAGSSA